MFRQTSARVSAALTRHEARSQGTNQKPDTEIYSHVPLPQAGVTVCFRETNLPTHARTSLLHFADLPCPNSGVGTGRISQSALFLLRKMSPRQACPTQALGFVIRTTSVSTIFSCHLTLFQFVHSQNLDAIVRFSFVACSSEHFASFRSAAFPEARMLMIRNFSRSLHETLGGAVVLVRAIVSFIAWSVCHRSLSAYGHRCTASVKEELPVFYHVHSVTTTERPPQAVRVKGRQTMDT